MKFKNFILSLLLFFLLGCSTMSNISFVTANNTTADTTERCSKDTVSHSRTTLKGISVDTPKKVIFDMGLTAPNLFNKDPIKKRPRINKKLNKKGFDDNIKTDATEQIIQNINCEYNDSTNESILITLKTIREIIIDNSQNNYELLNIAYKKSNSKRKAYTIGLVCTSLLLSLFIYACRHDNKLMKLITSMGTLGFLMVTILIYSGSIT